MSRGFVAGVMDEHGGLAAGLNSGVSDADRSFSVLHGSGRRMAPQSPNEALQPDAPPPPPPKPPSQRRPTLSAISGFISFAVVAAGAALAVVTWSNNRVNAPGPLPTNKIVYIAPHTDLPDIIDKLNSEGVIDNPLTMNVVLTAERKRGKVKAGEFLFKQHASLRDVIETLVSGRQYLHPFTIPEGLTTQQIVQRIRDSDLFSGDIRDMPKEGALQPETYKVFRGMTRADLLIKMQEDDRHLVEQVWSRRSPDLPLRSPYDLVTLASIVEKETGKADERPRIAGVFMNRLRRHMRLQSDPTIVYGLVGGQGTLGHSITRAELEKKTSYNTYEIDGLPPGPIDNPGRAALEAVANPSRTSDLYFVADGTGGHAFSGTIDEHNKNVQRWREIEREAKDKVDVDKLSPSAVQPPAKNNQRSEADDAAFGKLSPKIKTASLGHLASFVDPEANDGIDEVFAADERGPAPASSAAHKGRGKARAAAKMPDPASYATSVDAMGFSLADVGGARGSDMLDGPVTPADAGPAPTAGLPAPQPAAVAVPTATAMAMGAKPPLASQPAPKPTVADARATLDVAPGDHPDLFADPQGGGAAVVPVKAPPEHPRIYDASENTPFDPLRNKSFDLNTAKTIPADLVR